MSDAEDKTAEQLAAELNGPQNEQVGVAEDTSQPSSGVQETSGEPILGKFKTQEELIRGYQELEHKLRTTRPVEPSRPAQQPAESPAIFDPETEHGISRIVEARLAREKALQEQERAEAFARKHADELSDPLLRGAVLVEIQEANARGEYLDQESALANAKAALERRLNPKVEAAKKESFDEGISVARRKEQAGAVGGTNTKTPEVDPETLSAEEYAAYYGLK